MKTVESIFSALEARTPLLSGSRARKKFGETVFMALALIFSFFLMFHTFSYDSQKQEMRIASKAWSDFGAHIPLIRSFSYGPNYERLLRLQPIESPLFPGEPIRYHFGFYALVGVLEKFGLRIDWALNIPSALGFFLLLFGIALFSYRLFHSYRLTVLSLLFFLFNGSLSFIDFFKKNTVADIFTNSRFPSFGPWDGGNITAFWTLNIYTNQRHLALSYAMVLAILIIRKKPVLPAVLLSVLLFLNYPAATIAALFLLFQQDFLPLLLVTPAFLLLQRYANLASSIAWQPGYLAADNVLRFWFQNLGFHLILIPLGILLAPKSIRWKFGPPLLLLFLLPNLFRFSPDMINNHKFFNFFLILGNMFSAYAVFRIRRLRLIIPILMLSGVIDFFPIINDYKRGVPDIAVNPDAQFFVAHATPTDIIANSTWFYHPASLAGHALYSGYTYFTWSYGYDQVTRENILKSIYEAPNQKAVCPLLTENHIAYIELNKNPESYVQPNWQLWDSLQPVYINPSTRLRTYETKTICL